MRPSDDTKTTTLPPLPLPHERDETAGGQVAPTPDPVIEQAKRDLDAGMVDTDMRQTPGLDAERRRRLVPTPTVPADQGVGHEAPRRQKRR